MTAFDPRTEKTEERVLSNWVTLVSKTYNNLNDKDQSTYHSFKLRDYITILAVTEDGKIPLVRQYRPARSAYSLELPAGIREVDEEPAITAQRELWEETGFSSDRKLQFMGQFAADTGRLSNDVWFYFADKVFKPKDREWKAEVGVEVVLYTKEQLMEAIRSGEFWHSMHLGALGLAILWKQFSF